MNDSYVESASDEQSGGKESEKHVSRSKYAGCGARFSPWNACMNAHDMLPYGIQSTLLQVNKIILQEGLYSTVGASQNRHDTGVISWQQL